ncbi:MAG: BrnA antitoxin family protein [Azoarcus sp.]|jgi:uncharacterized protein (DUF4415 family)|nr:BrnA antitoxin family protein [Azoarcus sp.]
MHTPITLAHKSEASIAAVFATANEARLQKQVTLCLDGDVVESLRETGPDWQDRFNNILRHWLVTHSLVQ